MRDSGESVDCFFKDWTDLRTGLAESSVFIEESGSGDIVEIFSLSTLLNLISCFLVRSLDFFVSNLSRIIENCRRAGRLFRDPLGVSSTDLSDSIEDSESFERKLIST